MNHRVSGLATLAVMIVAGCSPGADGSGDQGRQDTAVAAPARVDSAITSSENGSLAPMPDSVKTPGAVRPAAAKPGATPTRTPPAEERRILVGDNDLTGVGYAVGDPAAPVVLLNFSDFGCPYCGKFARETYPALEREYIRTGKVYFKYVPFVMGTFPNGEEAARAAECAADAGNFWRMHDGLYERQAEWKRASDPRSVFQQIAAGAGLDRARFDACYAATGLHPRTRRANRVATDLGVRVTPSFLVNDRPIEGALPLADFRRVIEAALLLERSRR